MSKLTTREKVKLKLCYNAVVDKKAIDVRVLDLRGISSIADFFMICEGSSSRQVDAISDSVEKALRDNGMKQFHVEGKGQGTWVLMDCKDIIIHVFQSDVRKFYALENLWVDAGTLEAEEIESWKVN
ncbi:MAG: ribosome silencing factor [Nitrospinota bacterium]|nr:ribosome silencing factor [Nitrospinota bacterium]